MQTLDSTQPPYIPPALVFKDAEGRESVCVGTGSTKALVYVPETEQAARRNLHFHKANHEAYKLWLSREPARRAAEEAKAKVAAVMAERETVAARGLAAYNDQGGTNHRTWASVFFPRPVNEQVVEAWIQLVRHIDGSK